MVTSAGLLLYRNGATDDGREARPTTDAPAATDVGNPGTGLPAAVGTPVATDVGNAGTGLQVFIAHMGGPFWRSRPRAWSIPKGELETLPDGTEEDAFTAATREFAEEIGVPAPDAPYDALGTFRQSSGKQVVVFAAESSLEVDSVGSSTFSIELPRGSGRFVAFPEVDEARWVAVSEARVLLVAGQVEALDALVALLDARSHGGSGTRSDP